MYIEQEYYMPLMGQTNTYSRKLMTEVNHQISYYYKLAGDSCFRFVRSNYLDTNATRT